MLTHVYSPKYLQGLGNTDSPLERKISKGAASQGFLEIWVPCSKVLLGRTIAGISGGQTLNPKPKHLCIIVRSPRKASRVVIARAENLA